MISEFKHIEELFKEIDTHLTKKVQAFVIGGAVLLYHGLKPATKDIDIVIYNSNHFTSFEEALKAAGFEPKFPPEGYERMNLDRIFSRDDFRIDIFHKTVCKGFSLSGEMIKRAEDVLSLANPKVSLCSNEDVFLFKTLTEREGDLEDCISLAQRELNWNIVLKELRSQIHSGQDVWITWVGERLDILEEKGLTIPIMPEINRLREEYFEKSMNSKTNQ